MKKILPPSIEAIGVPIALLLVLVMLSVFAFNFGFSRISSQQAELAVNDKNENILKTKQTLLTQVAGTIQAQANAASLAVPDENSGLMVLAQLKNLAIGKSVTLDNLRMGGPVKEGGVFRVEITFDTEGSVASVFDYITSISGFSPITTISKVKLNQSQGAARANVTLEAYWAPFPTALPKFTEPIKELSGEDTQLLSKLSVLSAPPFSRVSPSTPAVRADPFSF